MSSVRTFKKYLISAVSFIGYGVRFLLVGLISFLLATLPFDLLQAKANRSEAPNPPIDSRFFAKSNYLTLSGREPRVISADEAVQIMKDGRAILVETRPPQDYARAHIAGSINMPFMDQKAISPLVGKGPVLLFCDYQKDCQERTAARGIISNCKRAAGILANQLGYENVALVESTYLNLKRKRLTFYYSEPPSRVVANNGKD